MITSLPPLSVEGGRNPVGPQIRYLNRIAIVSSLDSNVVHLNAAQPHVVNFIASVDCQGLWSDQRKGPEIRHRRPDSLRCCPTDVERVGC